MSKRGDPGFGEISRDSCGVQGRLCSRPRLKEGNGDREDGTQNRVRLKPGKDPAKVSGKGRRYPGFIDQEEEGYM